MEPGKFEWTATMVNINAGMNPELLAKCKTLGGYATFVDKVRTYNKSMPLTDAVDQAVDECVEDGVLEEFLNKHRKEVRNMVLTEFDEEKFLKMMREEERAEGHRVGLAAGRMESLVGILRDLGEIPPEILERARDLDVDALKHWTKLAL